MKTKDINKLEKLINAYDSKYGAGQGHEIRERLCFHIPLQIK